MFQKNELKILSPFYAHSLLFNLSKVIMPFYVLYFLDIGFSFFQIALISSIRSAISLIFEIPTGVIADKYGRKKSVFSPNTHLG
jgi:MFS family permease